MISIHKNTLLDLEFFTVLQQVADYCICSLGKEAVLHIQPIKHKEILYKELLQTNEFLASYQNNNRIPNHGFDPIIKELKLLGIENSFLEVEGLRKILSIVQTTNTLLTSFDKFKDYYPNLYTEANKVSPSPEIVKAIEALIDRFGEIKDNATPELFEIRQQINVVRGKINQSFSSALNSCSAQDLLDDIKETVVDKKRVLAVKAMHRKKVKGAILGASKTGSIVFIEPQQTLQYSRELANLEYEEEQEIIRILKTITNFLRPYSGILESYQQYLIQMDVLNAKAKYAQSMNAILPEINSDKKLYLRDAYHPLLYLTNLKKKETTFPQTIELNPDHRIIVISGPNAGGKSITLKTVGLLQVMLQSGLLVPLHERSSMCLFDRVLSDIGDNQSIENHLSTYSYRLKQMNYFLRKCDSDTLFLIDEFGTGSDPELGGALAETFLEVFYEREAFGIITTHYANLKLLANELPNMQNANMLFNQNSLQPMYKLVTGQAGSSFTFEVAQKNGIPFNLINKAKKKIERGKVRFDATIAKLQKERAKLEKTERSLKQNEIKKQSEAEKLEEINIRVQKKLESYQELYDNNQKLIYLGQKVNDLAENYLNNKQKRTLLNELFKLVQIENSKRKQLSKSQQKTEKAKEQEIKKEVEKKVEVIRQKKKAAKKAATEQPVKPKPILKVGDRVRLEDSRAVGSIDKIEKNKAIVNYGMFTTSVSVEQLELVEAAK